MILKEKLRNLIVLSMLIVPIVNASESEVAELDKTSSPTVVLESLRGANTKPLSEAKEEGSNSQLITPATVEIDDSGATKGVDESDAVKENVIGINANAPSLKQDLDSGVSPVKPQDDNNKQSLTLLGSSVEPGEAALLKWSLNAAFVENSTPVPVLVVNGVKSGPTLCLTAAVHGDELNGIEIVRRIVHEKFTSN